MLLYWVVSSNENPSILSYGFHKYWYLVNFQMELLALNKLSWCFCEFMFNEEYIFLESFHVNLSCYMDELVIIWYWYRCETYNVNTSQRMIRYFPFFRYLLAKIKIEAVWLIDCLAPFIDFIIMFPCEWFVRYKAWISIWKLHFMMNGKKISPVKFNDDLYDGPLLYFSSSLPIFYDKKMWFIGICKGVFLLIGFFFNFILGHIWTYVMSKYVEHQNDLGNQFRTMAIDFDFLLLIDGYDIFNDSLHKNVYNEPGIYQSTTYFKKGKTLKLSCAQANVEHNLFVPFCELCRSRYLSPIRWNSFTYTKLLFTSIELIFN